MSGYEKSPDHGDPPPTTRQRWARRICGAVLIAEGIAVAVLSIPLVIFGGLGVIGLFGAFCAIWLGIAVLRSRIHKPVEAALSAVGVGILLALPVTAVVMLSNCGFMGGGCSRDSEVLIVGVPLSLVLLNGLIGWTTLRLGTGTQSGANRP